MEHKQGGNTTKTGLLRKILFASGALFSVIGLFELLFANRIVGMVLIAAGLSDMAFSCFLPGIMERQSKNGD